MSGVDDVHSLKASHCFNALLVVHADRSDDGRAAVNFGLETLETVGDNWFLEGLLGVLMLVLLFHQVHLFSGLLVRSGLTVPDQAVVVHALRTFVATHVGGADCFSHVFFIK